MIHYCLKGERNPCMDIMASSNYKLNEFIYTQSILFLKLSLP